MSLGKLMYKKLKTEEIIVLAQKNDYKAMDELIKREQRNVYISFLYLSKDSHRVPDLTQEALLRMAKGLSSLRSPKTFKSWLNQIVNNLFYDELRKKNHRLKTLSLDAQIDSGTYTTSPHLQVPDKKARPMEKCLSCELDKIIKDEIQSLPEHFRVPILMREIQGLSYDEIAKATNTTMGTVKSRIARARIKLQEVLKNYI